MPVKLELKVFYVETFLGLSIDQVTLSSRVPLTSYYLWPRTDAWEQIKLELDSKPWVDNTEKVRVLNSAVEIMNYWRENRHMNTRENLKTTFPELNFVNLTK